AGERESGTLCACCGREIAAGDAVAICRACGAVHHGPCWDSKQCCSSYECANVGAPNSAESESIMKITASEVAAAEPLPTRPALIDANQNASDSAPRRPRWNRVAIGAFVVAILGIPLFGLVTGLIAIVIACVALAGHSHGRRGLAMAVVAIII